MDCALESRRQIDAKYQAANGVETNRWRFRFAGYLIALVFLFNATAWATTFPELSGRVVDEANILNPATRLALSQKLAARASETDQMVVVTLKGLQGVTIEDYGVQLGRHWRIGQAGKDNGILLIVVPSERQVRIEVGYGLEGILPDAIAQLIIQSSILPYFRTGDFAGGITHGVDDILQVLAGDVEGFKRRIAKQADRVSSVFAMTLTISLLLILYALRNWLSDMAGSLVGLILMMPFAIYYYFFPGKAGSSSAKSTPSATEELGPNPSIFITAGFIFATMVLNIYLSIKLDEIGEILSAIVSVVVICFYFCLFPRSLAGLGNQSGGQGGSAAAPVASRQTEPLEKEPPEKFSGRGGSFGGGGASGRW